MCIVLYMTTDKGNTMNSDTKPVRAYCEQHLADHGGICRLATADETCLDCEADRFALLPCCYICGNKIMPGQATVPQYAYFQVPTGNRYGRSGSKTVRRQSGHIHAECAKTLG